MTADPTPPPAARKGRRLLVAGALGLLLAGGTGVGIGWYLQRPPAATPPEVPTADVDPVVAEALGKARQDVVARPRDPAAWGELGKLFRAHGWMDESIACFAEAGKLDPNNPRWTYLIGVTYLLNDAERAVPYLQRAAGMTHAEPAARTATRLALAETLLARGEIDEAEKLVREEHQRDRTNSRVLYDLGLVALARDDLKAAAERFMATGGDPYTSKRASAQLMQIYRRLGDPGALRRWEKIFAETPDDLPWPDPYVGDYLKTEAGRQGKFGQAMKLEAQGKLREAVQIMEDVARDYPDARSYVVLGIQLLKFGNIPRGAQMLEAALRLEPDNVQAHYYLAYARFQEAEALWPKPGERELAKAILRDAADHGRRATELKPDHALAHMYRGRALGYLGEREPAVAALRLAVSCRPEMAEPHLYLGELLAEAGRAEEAVKELRLAEQLAGPKDDRPRKALERLKDVPKKTG